jgi:hypothetical protein
MLEGLWASPDHPAGAPSWLYSREKQNYISWPVTRGYYPLPLGKLNVVFLRIASAPYLQYRPGQRVPGNLTSQLRAGLSTLRHV